MTKNQYKSLLRVPETVREIRTVKLKLSKEIEKLGWDGFHKKAERECADLMVRVEKARLEKLAAKR